MQLYRSDAVTCSSACRKRWSRRPKLPPQMTSRDRWMRRSASKRPLTIDGKQGSSTNPRRWSSYAEAVRSTVGAGLGYALGDGIGCWDLDDCFDSDQLKPWAREIIESIDSLLFTEVSQSGRGIHVFVETNLKRGTVKRFEGHRVEFYPDGRYIAVTGVPLKP